MAMLIKMRYCYIEMMICMSLLGIDMFVKIVPTAPDFATKLFCEQS